MNAEWHFPWGFIARATENNTTGKARSLLRTPVGDRLWREHAWVFCPKNHNLMTLHEVLSATIFIRPSHCMCGRNSGSKDFKIHVRFLSRFPIKNTSTLEIKVCNSKPPRVETATSYSETASKNMFWSKLNLWNSPVRCTQAVLEISYWNPLCLLRESTKSRIRVWNRAISRIYARSECWKGLEMFVWTRNNILEALEQNVRPVTACVVANDLGVRGGKDAILSRKWVSYSLSELFGSASNSP